MKMTTVLRGLSSRHALRGRCAVCLRLHLLTGRRSDGTRASAVSWPTPCQQQLGTERQERARASWRSGSHDGACMSIPALRGLAWAECRDEADERSEVVCSCR